MPILGSPRLLHCCVKKTWVIFSILWVFELLCNPVPGGSRFPATKPLYIIAWLFDSSTAPSENTGRDLSQNPAPAGTFDMPTDKKLLSELTSSGCRIFSAASALSGCGSSSNSRTSGSVTSRTPSIVLVTVSDDASLLLPSGLGRILYMVIPWLETGVSMSCPDVDVVARWGDASESGKLNITR